LGVTNRFTNFAVAMESYHRSKFPPATVAESAGEPTSLDKKIQRILGQIAKASDRRWQRDRLEHAEVGLKERITRIIMSLPLELEKGRCEQFGEECGQRRNDLSHYGGRRDNTRPYDDFHGDLYLKSEALFYLLHVLILQELGIAADILRRFVYQSHASFKIKHAFVAVGLLDKSVLKPPSDTAEVRRLRDEEKLGPAAIARRLGIGRASVSMPIPTLQRPAAGDATGPSGPQT
jgi:ApeA N-terminal domain 1